MKPKELKRSAKTSNLTAQQIKARNFARKVTRKRIIRLAKEITEELLDFQKLTEELIFCKGVGFCVCRLEKPDEELTKALESLKLILE